MKTLLPYAALSTVLSSTLLSTTLLSTTLLSTTLLSTTAHAALVGVDTDANLGNGYELVDDSTLGIYWLGDAKPVTGFSSSSDYLQYVDCACVS